MIKNKFDFTVSKIFFIKNKNTKEVKGFKNRVDFIKFLEENVRLNEKNLVQFKKDIKLLNRELLVYKYLPDWYVKEE